MVKKIRVKNERTDDTIAGSVAVADNPWTRMKGLLGKKGLPDAEALLIRPCSSVHTYFMRFDLDVIFLDRDNQVLKVVRDLRTFRFSGARRSHSVIEFGAGALAGIDIEPGDRLLLDEAIDD